MGTTRSATAIRRRSWIVAASTVVAVILPIGWALASGAGSTARELNLSSGQAWLASPREGLMSLIDGPSSQVVAILAAPSDDNSSVVQLGLSALVAEGSTGSVLRIDGATLLRSKPYRFAAARSDLSILTSADAAFVVDATTRQATVIDPVSLEIRRRVTMAARPGAHQSLVDATGRLWAVDADGSGLNWYDTDGSHDQLPATASDQLVSVNGRPAIVDVGGAQPTISWLSRDGTATAWNCRLATRAGDSVQLLGAASGDQIFAAVSQAGTFLTTGATGAGCGGAVSVGAPGAHFGGLVQSGRFVFVPNLSDGRTYVIDTTRPSTVFTSFPLAKPGHNVQLIARDGLVFYNDLDSEAAGVLSFDDGMWRQGKGIQKYNPGNPVAEVPPTTNPLPPTGTVAPSSRSSTTSVASTTNTERQTVVSTGTPSSAGLTTTAQTSSSPALITSTTPTMTTPTVTTPTITTPTIRTPTTPTPTITTPTAPTPTITAPTVTTPTAPTPTVTTPTVTTPTAPTPTVTTPTARTPTTPTTPTPTTPTVTTPTPTVPTTPMAKPVVSNFTVAPASIGIEESAVLRARISNAAGAKWTATIAAVNCNYTYTSPTTAVSIEQQRDGAFSAPLGPLPWGCLGQYLVVLRVSNPAGAAPDERADLMVTSDSSTTPAVSTMSCSPINPALGESVTCTAAESVVGSRGTWTWSVTDADDATTVQAPLSQSATADFSPQLTRVGHFTVTLTVTYRGATDSATADLRSTVAVPDELGQQSAPAADAFRAAGLVPTLQDIPSHQPAGTVVQQTPSGSQALFGDPITVAVSSGPPAVRDLLDAAPSAHWQSMAGDLPWQGSEVDANGFARKWATNEKPLEDHSGRECLETHPQWIDDGYIRGTFTLENPIISGDHFKALIGFRSSKIVGDVVFSAGVTESDGTSHEIFAQQKSVTGSLVSIDVDLTNFAGAQSLYLKVDANGTSTQDWAVWVDPRVE